MNKARRHELKMLKYKKRMKQLCIDDDSIYAKNFAYRSHGSPCSCGICRDLKYRDVDRKKEFREFNEC